MKNLLVHSNPIIITQQTNTHTHTHIYIYYIIYNPSPQWFLKINCDSILIKDGEEYKF